MISTKMFSSLVLGALVVGVGLVAMSAIVESEFLRRLGVFPLLFAMFLLPKALLEWEASRAVPLDNLSIDEAAHLSPNATAADTATRP